MSGAPSAGQLGFLDTNVVIYAFTADPRSTVAQQLLASRCAISVQVLNEFSNVARRKLGLTWPELQKALTAIRKVCPTIVPLDVALHEDALRLVERHTFSFFDGVIAAAARRANCTTLWSEDMHHGLTIDGTLRIQNPFRRT